MRGYESHWRFQFEAPNQVKCNTNFIENLKNKTDNRHQGYKSINFYDIEIININIFVKKNERFFKFSFQKNLLALHVIVQNHLHDKEQLHIQNVMSGTTQ